MMSSATRVLSLIHAAYSVRIIIRLPSRAKKHQTSQKYGSTEGNRNTVTLLWCHVLCHPNSGFPFEQMNVSTMEYEVPRVNRFPTFALCLVLSVRPRTLGTTHMKDENFTDEFPYPIYIRAQKIMNGGSRRPMVSQLVCIILSALGASATVLYDGRVPLGMDSSILDASAGPFSTAVKGPESASSYTSFVPYSSAEQAISVTIDWTSIFTPGNSSPQYGFRRTELIAQKGGNATALNEEIDAGVSVFHFSIKADETRPLNYTHEYQIVFIEPSDGSHVFGLQLGSPFTNPTGVVPAPSAASFKVLDHDLNVLFSTYFGEGTWHNFAIQVDWENITLKVFYSMNNAPLEAVTDAMPNTSAGASVVGDFHFGILKLPLVNPLDSATQQADVVHYGLQEGSLEGLIYSGVFIETGPL